MAYFVDVEEKARQVVRDPYGLRKIKKIQHEHEITDELIEECYQIAANVVKRYGDVYLPIFERMHMEREKRIKSRSMLEKALEVAE